MNLPQYSLLIAAPGGRLRDSLTTLLNGSARVRVNGTADTVPGALSQLSSRTLNFVILDSDLRDEAAWTLLSYLKSTRPDLRCLFLAGDFHEHARARKMGADMVLMKGFRSEELFALFSRILPLVPPDSFVFELPADHRKEQA